MDGDLGCIQTQILVRLIALEERVAIRDAEGINWRLLENEMTGIVRCDTTLTDLVKKFLNFIVAFKKEYNEMFAATSFVNIGKVMTGSGALTEMSAQS